LECGRRANRRSFQHGSAVDFKPTENREHNGLYVRNEVSTAANKYIAEGGLLQVGYKGLLEGVKKEFHR
jgi:hypothetical protein